MNVKQIQITKYVCGKCNKEHSTLESAEKCCMSENGVQATLKDKFEQLRVEIPKSVENTNEYVQAISIVKDLETVLISCEYTSLLRQDIQYVCKEIKNMCKDYVDKYIQNLCDILNKAVTDLDTVLDVRGEKYSIDDAYTILECYFTESDYYKYLSLATKCR